MPLLANAYALDIAFKQLTRDALHTKPEDFRRIETTAAGLKAFSTWNTTHTLQTGREACGGEGYLAINRFAALKADSDIFTTFEGDNTVLMQLVAKNLLTDFAATVQGQGQGRAGALGVADKSSTRGTGATRSPRTARAPCSRGKRRARCSVCARSGCCSRRARGCGR